MAALSDFFAAIYPKYAIGVAAMSLLLAVAMEIAGPRPMRPLMFALDVGVIGYLLLTLCFLAFAWFNSVLTPRYRASDLFLPFLLVVLGMSLLVVAMSNLDKPGSFHPSVLVLAALVSVMSSGLFASLLALSRKIHVWLS